MATLRKYQTGNTFNVEVYESGEMIDWRHGLNKQGFKYYQLYFEKFKALGGCGQLDEKLTRDELIESL